MAVHAESPRFEATEAFRSARELRRRFDEALKKTPEFLYAAGKIVLHPRPNNDTLGGYHYNVQWTKGDGTRFVVQSSYSNSRWGETLRVGVYTGVIGEGIDISILGINNDQGELRYRKAHANGMTIETCENDPRTILKAEEMLNKLTQG